MASWIDRACHALERLMGWALAAMVVMVFGNVVLRYGFNSGVSISEELSRWLFVWITFAGAVVAVRRNAHLGTDVVVKRLPPAARKGCRLVAILGMLVCCGLVLAGAWQQSLINLGTTSPVMEVSMTWLYAPAVLFAMLGTIALVARLARLLGTSEAEPSPLFETSEAGAAAHRPGGHASAKSGDTP